MESKYKLRDEWYDEYLAEHTIFSHYCQLSTGLELVRIYYDDLPPFVPKPKYQMVPVQLSKNGLMSWGER